MGRKTWKIDQILTILREEVEVREASEGSTMSVMKPPSHLFKDSPNSTALLITLRLVVFTVKHHIFLLRVIRCKKSRIVRTY